MDNLESSTTTTTIMQQLFQQQVEDEDYVDVHVNALDVHHEYYAENDNSSAQ